MHPSAEELINGSSWYWRILSPKIWADYHYYSTIIWSEQLPRGRDLKTHQPVKRGRERKKSNGELESERERQRDGRVNWRGEIKNYKRKALVGPFACNDSTDGNRVPSGLLWSRTSISKLHSEVMNKMSIKLKGFWILLKFVLPQSLTAVSTTALKLCQDWFQHSTVLSFALKLSPSPAKHVLLFPEHTPNDGSETQHLRIT